MSEQVLTEHEYGHMMQAPLDVLDDDGVWEALQKQFRYHFMQDIAGKQVTYGPRRHVNYEEGQWWPEMDYDENGDLVETGGPDVWHGPTLMIGWYWRAVTEDEEPTVRENP